MPVKNSAEYMRQYRANKKKGQPPEPATGSSEDARIAELEANNTRLQETITFLDGEVKRLKGQLAVEVKPAVETGPRPRPEVGASLDQKPWPSFGFSQPAPKPSSKKK